MRYGRAERLIQLALEMQAARGGLTISDIEEKFGVSRRTAIRMRDAVLRAFPQADEVPSADRQKRWRLPNGSAHALVGMTANDLATLEVAAQVLDQANLASHAESIRATGAKIRALLKDEALRQIDPDLEALAEAEGIAHRPGPRPLIHSSVFEVLREAIKSCRKVSFDYQGRGKDAPSERIVRPLGFIYGHRHYLVGIQEEDNDFRFFSLPAIQNLRVSVESFDRDPAFDLQAIVSRSFGVFDEEPVDIVWKFSPEAAATARQFLFHASQVTEDQPDGGLVVRFRAGGLLEMAWHLMSWGRHVEVLEPASLRAMMPRELPDWPALP